MSNREKIDLSYPVLRERCEGWFPGYFRSLDERQFFRRVSLNWTTQPRLRPQPQDKKSKNNLASWAKTG